VRRRDRKAVRDLLARVPIDTAPTGICGAPMGINETLIEIGRAPMDIGKAPILIGVTFSRDRQRGRCRPW
jgi:hypothetical protein